MSKIRKRDIKILLMQIREHSRVKEEELDCFVKYSGLDISQFEILDVFKTPTFKTSIIDNYDALFVGGASSANVLLENEYSFLQNSRDLLNYCIENKKPVFASCFGFQLAIQALGGEIIHQEEEFEMGTVPINLTESGKGDVLFNNTPNGFYAVSVHQQKATQAPEQTDVLAITEQCIHAIKVKDSPFWAFQFHPEVDKAVLTHRLGVYRDKYTQNSEQFDQIIQNSQDTPESNLLLKKFVDIVLLKP